MSFRSRCKYVSMQKVIPEGVDGPWAVEHYEVTQAQSNLTRVRSAFQGNADIFVPPGHYARLTFGADVVMSDTQMEQRTCLNAVLNAHGDMLVFGLGLGMILVPILRNPKVKTVTVVEKYPEVIGLVEPHLREFLGKKPNKKLNVIQGDAFEWRAPKGVDYNVIYFDIWTNICGDNLQEITRLKRRHGRRLKRKEDSDAWLGAWYESGLRLMERRY